MSDAILKAWHRAKVAAIERAALRLLAAASRQPDRRLIWLTHLLERVPRTEFQRQQLRLLRGLFERKHPAIELARRAFNQLHPNYQRRLISNLFIEATWLGECTRREFAEREGFRPPFLIAMSPTMHCNLHCVGCYAGGYPWTDYLSFQTLDRLLTEAKEMGIHFFVVTGGEPFVRKDLFDLYEKHNDCSFLVYTNGTLINEEQVERMVALGNVGPALSIEGFKKETDARRGDGVFDKIMHSMDLLRDAGVLFGFSGTVTRNNVDVFTHPDFIDLMIEKGCLFGWTFIYIPIGRSPDLDLRPTPEQRDKMRQWSMQVRRSKPIFVADFWNDGCLTGGCMSGGTLYLHLNYRGDIEPCVFMQFKTDNLVELYQQGKSLKDALNSPFFQAVRRRNRKDPNKLRPCMIIDHNEWLAEAVAETGAQPSYPGAETIVTELASGVRAWGEEYAKLAEEAWNSTEYDFFKDPLNWATTYDDPEALTHARQGGKQDEKAA
jgi:MoaA/NifB/PqqE/SkfB family radical SAM enzyme